MKVILSILVVAAIAAVAIAHYGSRGIAPGPEFRTLPVTRGDLLIGVTATGTVEPVEIIDVGAQIVGSIKSFGTDPGRPGKPIDFRSQVKQGAVLARLDDLPHKAELDKAQASLRMAEAELTLSRARYRQRELAFLRAKELRETKAEAEYERAEAEYEMAKAEVVISEAKVNQAEIARKQAEINLAYTVISSPVDGEVIDRRVNVGQTVVAGMNAPSLFLLARDLHQMLVWAAVNEADIGEVYVGQTVSFTVDAYRDQRFSGQVSQIRLNASLQQNVVTYGVIVDVDNPDGKLLPYMTAKLQFEVARRENALLVANQALRWQPTWSQVSPRVQHDLPASATGVVRSAAAREQSEEEADQEEARIDLGSPTVWTVAEDGFVRPVPVELGVTDGMLTEIVGGDLQPGHAVVIGAVRKAEPDFVSSFITRVMDRQE
jgi:HlyD family secretion protein